MGLDLQKSTALRLSTAVRAYRGRVGHLLAHIGLHAGQEGVLKVLGEGDGRSMAEIAAALNVQPPTVTKMVSRLQAQGYVERRASTADRRQARVFLTEAGKGALVEIDAALAQVERAALAGIDDKDRRKLRRMLRRIARNLGDSAANGSGEGLEEE